MLKVFTSAMAGVSLLFLGLSVHAADSDWAAKVNGVEIDKVKLESTYNIFAKKAGMDTQKSLSPEDLKVMKQQLLEVLISQELVWQYSEKNDFIASNEQVEKDIGKLRASFPTEEAFKEKIQSSGFTEEDFVEETKQRLSVALMIKDLNQSSEVTDKEIEDFYTANKDRFHKPDQIRVRHILIQVTPDADQATKDKARERIVSILKEVKMEGADFAELAKKYSEGPSAKDGGDLGLQNRGRFVKSFDEAAFSLQKGEVSDIVETQFGYHIIFMQDRVEGQLVSLEEAKGQIREYLRKAKGQQALKQLVEKLRSEANVEIAESI